MKIINGLTSATVSIDTAKVAVGTYSLVLESYDTANMSSTIIKADSITIIVNEYVRSSSIESIIKILKENTETFFVENVAPTIPIPTTPLIKLRDSGASPLGFVTITNSPSGATVSIDTTGIDIGEYELELESYDSLLSAPQDPLKTDSVKIYVTEYVRYVGVQSSISIMVGDQGTLSFDHV